MYYEKETMRRLRRPTNTKTPLTHSSTINGSPPLA